MVLVLNFYVFFFVSSYEYFHQPTSNAASLNRTNFRINTCKYEKEKVNNGALNTAPPAPINVEQIYMNISFLVKEKGVKLNGRWLEYGKKEKVWKFFLLFAQYS